MELFTHAGVDLPSTGDPQSRPGRALSKALRTALFNYKVVEDAKARGARLFQPTPLQTAAVNEYVRKISDPNFLKQSEVAVRHVLIQDILQVVLGYTPFDPGKPYSLAIEWPIRGGAVDVGLGHFNRADGGEELIAPFELKGPGTTDLDRIMPGRGRSPVQQAWDYAIDAPGARWVMVSNCLEIRLYRFGRGRNAFELFDLRKLDQPGEHHRLWLILAEANLFGGDTDRLLADTDNAYRAITNKLYEEYSGLRVRLIGFLTNNGGGPALPQLRAIEIAQKLLDRILFIAFAQRTDLMADNLLRDAAKTINNFAPQPLWQNFLGLFKAVDQGNKRLDVPAYNGGLFSQDPVADTIMLPDHLAEEIAGLGQWDYRREVPVTVLGHLFEQSIVDIETLKSGAPPAVSKKKREGVVYTPDTITRFLVEKTIALSLDERREALWRGHDMTEDAPRDRQIAFWTEYLAALRDFTIVDPACGSGAFLVAAFDEMARRYRDAVTALEALEIEVDFDVFDRIVTCNLHGVDLNPESVEITRLSLWLKTARRDHRLENLEATIKVGDSLIEDPAFTARPFDWRAAFPEVFARGGFDVVIGNPPYVRMEHLKAIKPYLAKTYVVADDRTDLYAYFFERGAKVLKAGGRLGYISSSTFFKTGSGANLRTFLSDNVAIESVIDFGEVQVFEGVTTYPAILTLKNGAEAAGKLSFLAIKNKLPEDLDRAFMADGQLMPRLRLGVGSWQLESNALARMRAKIVGGRKTLAEMYGSPLYGIKTGRNEAFVVDRERRDALVAADPKSADLLKPFLLGENIKRWNVESDGLFLINTPKGAVDIDAYPAIRDWMSPFRDQLENRATKQEWWELQQAQVAYQERLAQPKIVWPHFQSAQSFTEDLSAAFLNNKCFFFPTADGFLLGLLNSSVSWFQLCTLARIKRGGYIEAEAQYVGQLAAPAPSAEVREAISILARTASVAATDRYQRNLFVRRRILDLAPPGHRGSSRRLDGWHTLSFSEFRAEIRKALKSEIPLKERRDWETYLAENAAEVNILTARIATAEREIDDIVYRLFDLTPGEIALLRASIAGQH